MKRLFVVSFCMSLCSCYQVGTHSYIKVYDYGVAKDSLQKAVEYVISHDTSISRSNYNDYHNDGNTYLRVGIRKAIEYDYVFRYGGDSTEWKNSPNESAIVIAYGWEGTSGGSDGHNDFQGKDELKQRIITVFEDEVISNIDSFLQIEHSEHE